MYKLAASLLLIVPLVFFFPLSSKILYGTCPFTTTNTFATFRGITKGENWILFWFEFQCCVQSGRVMIVSFPVCFVSRVTSLSMSPVDDTFISGSLDKTIRLWDLRSPNCQVSMFGCILLSAKCCCTYM